MISNSIHDPAFLSEAPMLVSSVSLETEVATWESNIIAAGSTVSNSTKLAVNDFVKACKTAGCWTKILDCGVLAGSNLAAARIKLKAYAGTSTTLDNPQNATNSQYSEAVGFSPSSTYCLQTNVVLSSISTNGQNLHLSLYMKDGFNGRPHGCGRGWVWERHYFCADTIWIPGGVGWAWGNYTILSSVTNGGFRHVQRRTGENAYHYFNGTSVSNFSPNNTRPTDYGAPVGASVSSEDGGTGYPLNYSGFTSLTVQFYSYGTAMSDAEVTAFSNAVIALQTALGRN